MSREFFRVRTLVRTVALGCLLAPGTAAFAQSLTPAAPAATYPIPTDPGDPKAHELLQQMVTAFGGQAWLDIRSTVTTGHTAAFFQGKPTGAMTDFVQLHLPPDRDRTELTKKRDVLEIITPKEGVEITYKGRQYLPQKLVDDLLRRRTHSIEAITHVWMKDPGTTAFYMGTEMVGRRQADIVRLVNAQNDNVTLDLDTQTHLPLRRSFRWRNSTYKDYDEESEEYEAYQQVQGFATPFNITQYRNGEMSGQRYITDVEYNVDLPESLFEPATVPLPAN